MVVVVVEIDIYTYQLSIDSGFDLVMVFLSATAAAYIRMMKGLLYLPVL